MGFPSTSQRRVDRSVPRYEVCTYLMLGTKVRTMAVGRNGL